MLTRSHQPENRMRHNYALGCLNGFPNRKETIELCDAAALDKINEMP